MKEFRLCFSTHQDTMPSPKHLPAPHLIDLIKGDRFSGAPRLCQHLGDGRREGGLAMVDMACAQMHAWQGGEAMKVWSAAHR